MLIEVNQQACERIAKLLARKAIPQDQEESSLPGFDPDSIGNFFFALVAICHQTSPQGRPPLEGIIDGKERRGWDYLFAKLENAARTEPTLLTPDGWCQLSGSDVQQIFRDPQLGDRLTDPDHRAALLRDLGSKMISRHWSFAD